MPSIAAYEHLKAITDSYYANESDSFAPQVHCLLLNNGILPRQKDGELLSLQISIPTSLKEAIVVGWRYLKKDGSNREDCFLFKKGQPILPLYKGGIERLLPEYKGTHKAQLKSRKELVPPGYEKVDGRS